MSAGHTLAAICLIAATVGAWFRADELVARRAARPGSAKPDASDRDRAPGDMPWRKFGGLRYFFTRFGLANSLVFLLMLCFVWFGMNFFLGLGPGGRTGSSASRSTGSGTNVLDVQLGMFIVIIGMISMLQVVPCLRILRTMPRRLSTITHCLVFWPLTLTVVLGLIAHVLHSLVYGVPVEWNACATNLVGGSIFLLGIPLILRFGLRMSTMIPILLLLSFSQGFSMFVSGIFKIELLSNWPALAASLVAMVGVVWFLTYRALGTSHPWRGSLMRLPGMQRRM